MFSILLPIIYLSFISLGLPDGLLGAAWPGMGPMMGVPLSWMGVISFLISVGTVISSLLSDRLTKRFGTGKVLACSVVLTALTLLGFSVSRSFFMLCLLAIPYGLGGGAVDAALNNFVALHYASRHMSWLHCMWGIGAGTGPYIMSYALSSGRAWPAGYGIVFFLQLILSVVIFLSLPLWKRAGAECEDETGPERLPMGAGGILAIPGAKEILIAFFAFSALEHTTGLWCCSYLVHYLGVSEAGAAGLAGIFFYAITVGRAISGFLTYKISDENMIRLGQGIVIAGILTIFLAPSARVSMAGIVAVGFGCAPIYPCIIHSTPAHFGRAHSQALIGVQMACAYLGNCFMPPLFGALAQHISLGLFPVALAVLAAVMLLFLERVNRIAGSA